MLLWSENGNVNENANENANVNENENGRGVTRIAEMRMGIMTNIVEMTSMLAVVTDIMIFHPEDVNVIFEMEKSTTEIEMDEDLHLVSALLPLDTHTAIESENENEIDMYRHLIDGDVSVMVPQGQVQHVRVVAIAIEALVVVVVVVVTVPDLKTPKRMLIV